MLAQLSDYGKDVSDHSENPEVKLDILSFPDRLNDRLYSEENLVLRLGNSAICWEKCGIFRRKTEKFFAKNLNGKLVQITNNDKTQEWTDRDDRYVLVSIHPFSSDPENLSNLKDVLTTLL